MGWLLNPSAAVGRQLERFAAVRSTNERAKGDGSEVRGAEGFLIRVRRSCQRGAAIGLGVGEWDVAFNREALVGL